MLVVSESMPPSSDNVSIIGMITVSVYVGGVRVHAASSDNFPIIGMITVGVYVGGFQVYAALQ